MIRLVAKLHILQSLPLPGIIGFTSRSVAEVLCGMRTPSLSMLLLENGPCGSVVWLTNVCGYTCGLFRYSTQWVNGCLRMPLLAIIIPITMRDG